MVCIVLIGASESFQGVIPAVDYYSKPMTISSTPVIGILAHPFDGGNESSGNNEDINYPYQYIAASYVKWLEAGGARAIPIPYDASTTLIDDIFSQINGLLLPGGHCVMPPCVPYLLDKIVESNSKGWYFPVWGTCLGFEFLIRYVGGPSALQDGFQATNVTLPLEELCSQELYADPTVFKTVQERPVAFNRHHQGIEPNHFMAISQLTNVWNITSINHDKVGRPFVSTIEPLDPLTVPLYGVQYHPEKNAFEYSSTPGTNIPYEAIDHSEEGIAVSMHLSSFFVSRVRHGKRENHHHDFTKPDSYPIMNTYPIQANLHFEQIYLLPNASHWNASSGTTTEEKD